MQLMVRSLRPSRSDALPPLEQLAAGYPEVSLRRWLDAVWGAGESDDPSAPGPSQQSDEISSAVDSDSDARRVNAAGDRPMILIVEDDPINRKVIRRMLSRLGYAYEIAENGQQALDRLQASAFDGVLMDIRMPVMDGIVATKTIRKMRDPKLAAVPIIAVTAQALEGNRETCINMGFNDYLPKPVKRASLAESLQRFVPRRP